MSILAIFTADNVNKQMYETLRKEVDWEHNHPKGLVLHSAALILQAIMSVWPIFGNQKRT
jgi:hypothetical protein